MLSGFSYPFWTSSSSPSIEFVNEAASATGLRGYRLQQGMAYWVERDRENVLSLAREVACVEQEQLAVEHPPPGGQ